MTQTLASDIIALIASEPENCLDRFRLIRPGETYDQGKDDTVLCPTCVSDLLIGEDFDTIQATDHLAVDYGGGLLRLRREGAAVVIAPQEVRHLVDALVEAGVRLADGKTREKWDDSRHSRPPVVQVQGQPSCVGLLPRGR